MSLAAGGAVALAAALDRTLSEPPRRVHPVALLGSLVAWLDETLPDSRTTGVILVVTVPSAFALLGTLAVLVAGSIDISSQPTGTWSGAVTAGVVLFVCSSHRLLIETAREVVSLTETDPEAARERLRSLAGRDATALSPGQIRSAAVESAAENLADGLLAPLLAFGVIAVVVEAILGTTVLAVALAAGAAAWVKAVNTLDSMLGYPHRRAGGPPARLDDLVMWLPARVAALALALAGSPRRLSSIRARARTAADEPTSPNSGWPMATLAATLDVRLEKPGAYTLFPDRDLPSIAVAHEGVRVVSRAGWLSVGAVMAVVVIG